MKRVFYTLLFCSLGLVGSHTQSFAQYKGGVRPAPQQQQDPAAKPIPKVFSSRASGTEQAEKLDRAYYALEVTLWNYGVTDLIYQRELYELLKPERFKITRYTAEFEKPLTSAMKNLKDNYNNLQAEIEEANAEYKNIRSGLLEEDLETIDALWKQRIAQFEQRSMTYFKMQNKFLNTYKSMVDFIISQGGSYAYNGIDGIRFYKVGGYKFFSMTLDKLRKTTYNQRLLLRENAPVNVDLSMLSSKGY